MARTLTIELTDELEQKVIAGAKQQQVSPETFVLQCLMQALMPHQPLVQSTRAKEAAVLYADRPQIQLEASRQRLLQFAGAIRSSDTIGLDNERIDADLAKAYGNEF